VRLAVPDDMAGMQQLVGGMSSAAQVQDEFLHALSSQGAVVALVAGQLVAAVVTSACSTADLEGWRQAHRLPVAGLPPPALADAAQHARLQLCVVNPVFATCTGALLAGEVSMMMRRLRMASWVLTCMCGEVGFRAGCAIDHAGALRLLGKACAHYELLLEAASPMPPELLALMQLQPSRQRQQAAASSAALFCFTRGMAHTPRAAVNTRLVIAGASETGLACLERLLCQPHVRFTSITLLAPGGAASSLGGVACQFTASRVARMGLQASVTVIDGHMVGLDTAERLVLLADGGRVPYDVLAVTTGLQVGRGVHTCARVAWVAHARGLWLCVQLTISTAPPLALCATGPAVTRAGVSLPRRSARGAVGAAAARQQHQHGGGGLAAQRARVRGGPGRTGCAERADSGRRHTRSVCGVCRGGGGGGVSGGTLLAPGMAPRCCCSTAHPRPGAAACELCPQRP
jgi:hypothetical protein